MPAPCSNDLRWQIVWLVLGIRKTTDDTARLMGVTRRTVVNILQRFRRYGSVRPSRTGRPNTMSSITIGELFMLMEYVMRYPGAYLREEINYIEGICGLNSVHLLYGAAFKTSWFHQKEGNNT